MGYAEFWWGVTPSALKAMIEIAGFEVEEMIHSAGFNTQVIARKIDRPSVIPLPGFGRERGVRLGHNLAGWADAD